MKKLFFAVVSLAALLVVGCALAGDPVVLSDRLNGFARSDEIPTNVGDLNNDAGYITSADVPTDVSDLNNDAGYVTSADVPTDVSDLNNDAGYITSSDIPAQVKSDWTASDPSSPAYIDHKPEVLTSSQVSEIAQYVVNRMAVSGWEVDGTWYKLVVQPFVPAAPTTITLADGTEEIWNVPGTLDRQWLIDAGYFDEDSGTWLKTITEVDFGGVTNIGEYAFSRCSSLTNVVISDSIVSIGTQAFEECRNLEAVHISDLEAWCNISFGEYYANPLGWANRLFLNGDEVRNLVIPEGVTSVGDWVFFECTSITNAVIPSGVASVGDYAFYRCRNLASVTIPNGVTNIGYSTFAGCYALTGVTIPNSVTSIDQMAFSECVALTGVTIPDSVTDIGYYSFSACNSLTNVTFGIGITNIDMGAFGGCGALTSVTIPDGAACRIKSSAFSGCSSLTSVTLGDDVTSIGSEAFWDCERLATAMIGDGVVVLNRDAFGGCSDLMAVDMSGRTAADIQSIVDSYGRTRYPWGLPSGCVITCSDGQLTVP